MRDHELMPQLLRLVLRSSMDLSNYMIKGHGVVTKSIWQNICMFPDTQWFHLQSTCLLTNISGLAIQNGWIRVIPQKKQQHRGSFSIKVATDTGGYVNCAKFTAYHNIFYYNSCTQCSATKILSMTQLLFTKKFFKEFKAAFF